MKKALIELKRPDPVKDSAIQVRMRCDDGMLKYYTGHSANLKTFGNAANQTIKNKIENEITRLQVECSVLGKPVVKTLVAERLDALLSKKKNTVVTLETMLTAVLEDMASGKILTPGSGRYSPETIRSIRLTVNNLTKFNPELRFQDVTLKTYREFKAWGVKNNWSLNTIGSQIKFWKTLMRVTEHLHGNNIHKHEDFKIIREETEDIHLEEDEIQAIYNVKLDVPEVRLLTSYNLARDWFVLNCYMGVRVSDLLRFSSRDIVNGFVVIATEKTDDKVIIPIHPTAAEILKKHKGFPAYMPAQKLNEYIKIVAEKAAETCPSLGDDFLYIVTKGGVRHEERIPKYKMISSHSGRRTSITNMRAAGVPDTFVMKLHGIKSAKTLERYTKLTPEKAAELAAKLDYFKG